MRDLDDIDLNILRLLIEDGRRPYSDIADRVGVSPPTVSDRIERLCDLGVIRRFTLDIDRALVDDGIEVLVEIKLAPDANGEVKKRLATEDAVEHVFSTADNRVVTKAIVPRGDVKPLLNDALDMEDVVEYDVTLVTDSIWSPRVGDGELFLSCTECGEHITDGGVSLRVDGELYPFCSDDCRTDFEAQASAVVGSTH